MSRVQWIKPYYAEAFLNTITVSAYFFLGVTGDMVLEPEVYEKIKASAISKVRGTVQADILKRRSGAEYLHFLLNLL